ncbi:hypothetical protein JKP88DRAFT_279407 [Tribonema minus]|uniref:Uncharacterized protein n=1 Tax=Tribonema minus TaxID=303371 RepID=A0A835YV87_9STRA|nr:hypothetical protein JKP88DRAFT_279407 [Tribonema minus]
MVYRRRGAGMVYHRPWAGMVYRRGDLQQQHPLYIAASAPDEFLSYGGYGLLYSDFNPNGHLPSLKSALGPKMPPITESPNMTTLEMGKGAMPGRDALGRPVTAASPGSWLAEGAYNGGGGGGAGATPSQ